MNPHSKWHLASLIPLITCAALMWVTHGAVWLAVAAGWLISFTWWAFEGVKVVRWNRAARARADRTH